MVARRVGTIFFSATLILLLSTPASGAAESEIAKIANAYEAQWQEVRALRIQYRRESRTRTSTNVFKECDWEMVGDRMKSLEGRTTTFPLDPLNPESKPLTANVVSLSYFDGEKTYELSEPAKLWPIAETRLEDYEELRRRGFRASISNRYKHWRFWFSCPIPRYFSTPSESEPISLPDLVAKYPSKILKRARASNGDSLVQLEIRDDSVRGDYESFFDSWTMYLSLNESKKYAVEGYQLNVRTKKDPNKKIVSEYTVDKFKEFGEGIWIPTNVEYRVHSAGQSSSLTKVVIRGVSINVPSPNFADFHFLPGMVVREQNWREGEEKPTILTHVWGIDAPETTYASDEEFWQFYNREYPYEEPKVEAPEGGFGKERNRLFFYGALATLLAFVGLAIYTRRAISRDMEEEELIAAQEALKKSP
ncbi:MAG: hypothetical protein Q4Q42_06155 [Planctomycetia bacterium]|nr:hypothetical protein [Planctomycetia bacterium]